MEGYSGLSLVPYLERADACNSPGNIQTTLPFMDCIFQNTKIDNRYIKKNNEISSSKHVNWRRNTEGRVITKGKRWHCQERCHPEVTFKQHHKGGGRAVLGIRSGDPGRSHCKQVDIWARTVFVGGQAWGKWGDLPPWGLKLRRCKFLTVMSGMKRPDDSEGTMQRLSSGSVLKAGMRIYG